LVRKKCRTSEMFFKCRRGAPEPVAKAASVPTLTSRSLGVGLARRVVVDFVAVASVRLAGVDLPVVDFLAAAFLVTFEGLLARTGRSLTARTSLSSDGSNTRPRGSGMDAVDGARGPYVQPQCIAKDI
jgi:hypothetical protein